MYVTMTMPPRRYVSQYEKISSIPLSHPSPLSAYRGFFGCGHFSRANQYLLQQGKDPIDWSLN